MCNILIQKVQCCWSDFALLGIVWLVWIRIQIQGLPIRILFLKKRKAKLKIFLENVHT